MSYTKSKLLATLRLHCAPFIYTANWEFGFNLIVNFAKNIENDCGKKWMTSHAFDSINWCLIGIRWHSFEFAMLKSVKRMEKEKKKNFQHITAKAWHPFTSRTMANDDEYVYEKRIRQRWRCYKFSITFISPVDINILNGFITFLLYICIGDTPANVKLNTKSRWAILSICTKKRTQISTNKTTISGGQKKKKKTEKTYNFKWNYDNS